MAISAVCHIELIKTCSWTKLFFSFFFCCEPGPQGWKHSILTTRPPGTTLLNQTLGSLFGALFPILPCPWLGSWPSEPSFSKNPPTWVFNPWYSVKFFIPPPLITNQVPLSNFPSFTIDRRLCFFQGKSLTPAACVPIFYLARFQGGIKWGFRSERSLPFWIPFLSLLVPCHHPGFMMLLRSYTHIPGCSFQRQLSLNSYVRVVC